MRLHLPLPKGSANFVRFPLLLSNLKEVTFRKSPFYLSDGKLMILSQALSFASLLHECERLG